LPLGRGRPRRLPLGPPRALALRPPLRPPRGDVPPPLRYRRDVSDAPLRAPTPRADVLAALASAPLFLALWRVAGTADRFPRLFGAAASDAASGLAPWLWQFGTFFWLFLALPLVHAMARRYALPAGPL